MVAQYGSTLTQVQRDEFVTLVLTPSRRFGGPSGAARMLSVPRSAIADYGAGKLTLEQLSARVLRYSSGSSPSGDAAVFGVGSTLFHSGAGAR